MTPPTSVAIIGTRKYFGLPYVRRDTLKHVARSCGQRKIPVRTGAAPGTDQVAAVSALMSGGSVTLVLPWSSYESAFVARMRADFHDRVTVEVFDQDASAHAAWIKSVREYHPASDRLTSGAFCLHARNYGIVAPADWITALPSPEGGGAGQGMRIGRGLGKRVFDLTNEVDTAALLNVFPL